MRHTYWYLRSVSLMSPDENSYSFLLWPKMMTATSTEQRTDSSCAFLNNPPFRLRKVLQLCQTASHPRDSNVVPTDTERLRSSLIALISIFLRPMMSAADAEHVTRMGIDLAATRRRCFNGGRWSSLCRVVGGRG